MTTLAQPWQFLKFVAFRDLFQWDAKRHFSNALTFAVPSQKLGDHILEFSEIVRPAKEPDKEFKILGVSNKVGLFDAYTETGRRIRQPYQRVVDGCLAYNPYRVNVGSIGLKTVEQEHDLISNAYVVFKCRWSLLPEFLYLLFRSDAFNQIIRDSTSGSVRQNLTFDLLSGMTIPLPPLAEQKRLVAAYRSALAKAAAAEAGAIAQQQEAARFLEMALGLKNEAAKPKFTPAKLYFFQFATLQRWGVTDESDQLKSAHPLVELGSLLELVQYGISEKAAKERTASPLLRMNNIGDGELDLTDLKYLRGKPEDYSDYLLRKGDILFNRTNSKELVGKTAVFTANGDYVFASYLIRLRLNTDRADAAFINYVFNSPFCRTQIDSISRQALGQANINSKELRLFLFPLPPLAEQRRIVERLDALRQAARTAQAQAEGVRAAAKSSFEGALFVATKET